MRKVLVCGFGNPGRRDDGLGVAFAEAVAKRFPDVGVEVNYQLNVEDALVIRDADVAIFADASRNEVGQFAFRRLSPAAEIAFTTHAMSPATVLAFCGQLYGRCPEAFLMEIGGRDWGLGEGLSASGEANLAAALVFACALLEQRTHQAFGERASQHTVAA
jgi:hydrogenase maturation protease